MLAKMVVLVVLVVVVQVMTWVAQVALLLHQVKAMQVAQE
jgi:hypothetical protein